MVGSAYEVHELRVGTAEDGPAKSLFNLATSVVGIVAGSWLLAQLLAARGRWQAGPSRFWPYVGMTILSALGTVLGLVLLIVPGIILLIRWSAASGYVIGERRGVTESLGKSWEATKGHSWPILGAAVVLFLGVVVAGGIVGGIFGLLGDMAVNIVSSLVEAVASAVLMTFGIAVYTLVSDDSGQLADTFA